MVLIDRDPDATYKGRDGTMYRVELKVKIKPDLGLVEINSRAERKARTALLIRKRQLKDEDLEHVDTFKLREMPFSMRAEYEVKYFVPNN